MSFQTKSHQADTKANKKGLLEEQTLGYYRRISEALKQDFESDEDKALFLQNVFKQLSQEALVVSQNQTASGIVEELVRSANRAQLTAVLQQFSHDWETSCCDRFASHVTQALVLRCGAFLGLSDDKSNDVELATSKSLEELFDELYEFLLSSISLYMQDTYASHVVRVLFEVLSGRPISESIVRSRMSRQQQQRAKDSPNATAELRVPAAEYSKKLRELCRHIVALKKLEDHVQHSTSNPVLQTVLVSAKSLDEKQCRIVCRRLSKNAQLFRMSPGKTSPDNITHEVGSHLVEQYLSAVPDELFDKVLSKHFTSRLVELARHPVANFVVQRLISCSRTPEQFESILLQLIGDFEHILAVNHVGVIVRLAESCVKHATCQKKFIKAVEKAFHCYKPEERRLKLVPLLASFSTYDVLYKVSDDKEPSADQKLSAESDTKSQPTVTAFNLHGSLLVQALLRFGNPHPAVDSLLALTAAELNAVCCSASGSHVIDAFLRSDTVGAASRELLYQRLSGQYFSLACDKSGSRTFDTLWATASTDQRTRIATELSRRADALRSHNFGAFIHERCALRLFITRPDEWKQLQAGQTRKRKLLQQLAEDIGGQPLVKRNKKKGS